VSYRPYDLRSDTVTKPTAELRRVLAGAEVGDDAYGDDPTVGALERRVAALLGKEAAVFVPTGTMANQLALHLHVRPGEAIAAAVQAHVLIHEDAGAARFSGAQVMPLGDRQGYSIRDLEILIAEEENGWPRVGLVWLENTIGAAGGRIWPLDGERGQRGLAAVARASGRPVHLDGARLWNAHVATGIALPELAAPADTVSVCLSKGLGAPAGSLLCGTAEFVRRARTTRHAFGGAMRQAGILAAAGLHVLDHHVARLADDHRRARELAAALAGCEHWEVLPVETNMVLLRVKPPFTRAATVCEHIAAAEILCHPNVHDEVRLVLHLGIDDDDLRELIERMKLVAKSLTKSLAQHT
jgi:threonine aldolase